MGSLRVAEAVGALVVGHATFTAIGIANATLAKPPTRLPASADDAACKQCSREAQLVKVVKKMYGGGGIDAAAISDDVTFTDPAAACRGRYETTEAFRALAAVCRPEHIEEPCPVKDSTTKGAVQFDLHQRYFRGSMLLPSGLAVKSTLVVHTSAIDGRITSLEERWNGAPLLQFSAFKFVRRVNGVVSSVLTPLLK